MTLRIGSLFSGYEGLGMAVQHIWPDAELAWVCDNDPAAAKVLTHHHPNVPNLGDITAVDWDTVEPVDIITGGSPCQDVSMAGRRLGMQPGTRSGLWTAMADAIATLHPSLVLFENVRGITSAPAHCDMELGPWDLGGPADGEPALRALGRVLGDLADLGFDAEWTGLPAAEVGAPHKRFRIFLLAWPAADAPHHGRQRGGGTVTADSICVPRSPALFRTPTAQLAVNGGSQHPDKRKQGGARPDAGGRGGAPADAIRALGVGSERATPRARDWKRGGKDGLEEALRPLPGALGATPRATDGTNGGPNQRGSSGDLMLPSAVVQLLLTPTVADARNTANFKPDGTPYGSGYGTTLTDAARLLPPATQWGQFAEAVARWETALGRLAPGPTEPSPKDGKPRLSPAFVEWMMGLPAGWVCDVPGLSRNDRLKLLGNGVVSQQCAHAMQKHLIPAWLAAVAAERAA